MARGRPFDNIYVIVSIGIVAVILLLFGNVLSGDWLAISNNWISLMPYLIGLSLAGYWFVRRRG